MSLKWFHIVFISLSVLLSLWFGVWGLFNQHIALGVLSLGASVGLVLYGNYFMSKLRKLGV
jgi:ABC-type multidrug transport system fused ATPase/permease subunit